MTFQQTAAARRCYGLIHLVLILVYSESFVLVPSNPKRIETRFYASSKRVSPLTVGPILGATTTTSARIFGRATPDAPCIGVARIRPEKEVTYSKECSFQIKPTFDYSGVVVFSNLNELTKYCYQVGFVEQQVGDTLDWSLLDWSRVETYSFQAATSNRNEKRSFVFGSCRYLLQLSDDDDDVDDRGDKTFRSILKQVDEVNTDAILMLGNQVYVDDVTPSNGAAALPLFNRRHRNAFSQQHIQSLMARLPTYMMPAKHDTQEETVLYPASIHSCLTYQLSHSPLFDVSNDGNVITGTPTKLWYTFSNGCCDFFMTDCRSERKFDRKLLSTEQMEALKTWLSDGKDTVKFIATSIPIAPDAEFPGNDTWSGFCDQRNELLDYIRQHKIRRVVFLSGNLHCSLSAKLTSITDPDFSVLSIVSSAFYWPYPNSWESQLEGTSLYGSDDEYQMESLSDVVRDNNFSRVAASLDELTVEVFDRKGTSLCKTKYSFQTKPSSSRATDTSPTFQAPSIPKARPSAPATKKTAPAFAPPPSPPPFSEGISASSPKKESTASKLSSGTDHFVAMSSKPAQKTDSKGDKAPKRPWSALKGEPTKKKEKQASKDETNVKSSPFTPSSLSGDKNTTTNVAENRTAISDEATATKADEPKPKWSPPTSSPPKKTTNTMFGAEFLAGLTGGKSAKNDAKSKDETEQDSEPKEADKSTKPKWSPPVSGPPKDTSKASGIDFLAAMTGTPPNKDAAPSKTEEKEPKAMEENKPKWAPSPPSKDSSTASGTDYFSKMSGTPFDTAPSKSGDEEKIIKPKADESPSTSGTDNLAAMSIKPESKETIPSKSEDKDEQISEEDETPWSSLAPSAPTATSETDFPEATSGKPVSKEETSSKGDENDKKETEENVSSKPKWSPSSASTPTIKGTDYLAAMSGTPKTDAETPTTPTKSQDDQSKPKWSPPAASSPISSGVDYLSAMSGASTKKPSKSKDEKESEDNESQKPKWSPPAAGSPFSSGVDYLSATSGASTKTDAETPTKSQVDQASEMDEPKPKWSPPAASSPFSSGVDYLSTMSGASTKTDAETQAKSKDDQVSETEESKVASSSSKEGNASFGVDYLAAMSGKPTKGTTPPKSGDKEEPSSICPVEEKTNATFVSSSSMTTSPPSTPSVQSTSTTNHAPSPEAQAMSTNIESDSRDTMESRPSTPFDSFPPIKSSPSLETNGKASDKGDSVDEVNKTSKAASPFASFAPVTPLSPTTPFTEKEKPWETASNPEDNEASQSASPFESFAPIESSPSPDAPIITQAQPLPPPEPEPFMVPAENLPPPEPPEEFVEGYVSTDRYVYDIGEQIEVTYQVFHPREWDYIAIFPASVPTNDLHHSNAIQWVNTCDGDRTALSCLGGCSVLPLQFPSRRPEKFPLAPGDYNVFFLRLGETDLPEEEDIIAKSSFQVINTREMGGDS